MSRKAQYLSRFLFAEISLQQALERSAVASLISCHLMDGIVDSVEAQFLKT